MEYNINYKNSVAKDLKRIGKSTAKRILDKIDKELTNNPDRFPALIGQFSGMRKLRVGDYRRLSYNICNYGYICYDS